MFAQVFVTIVWSLVLIVKKRKRPTHAIVNSIINGTSSLAESRPFGAHTSIIKYVDRPTPSLCFAKILPLVDGLQSRRSDLAMDPCDMRIFKRRYFNINRKLLMCLGLWPYETKIKMCIIRIIVISILTVLSLTQLIDVIECSESVDRQMMGILGFLTCWLMISKIEGMILTEENMKKMHRSVANNWQIIQDEEERDVLHKYAERARTVTIVYSAGLMGSAAIACALPSIPKIMDIIIPLENPRPEFSIFEGEYFIDKKEHFTLFFFLDYVIVMLLAVICVAFETTFIVSAEHCCSLYAIIRLRLLKLRRTVQKNSLAVEDGDSYEWLVSIIQLHQHALTFTSLLNESYSTAFLFLLFVALFVFPLGCCAIISQLHNPLQLISYGVYSVAVLVQGFVSFWPGQRIIDHQLSLYDAAYFSEWYDTPLRTRKLLTTFMLRCSRPVMITAGGLLEMNFELYMKITKTGVSYVMVASSFR